MSRAARNGIARCALGLAASALILAPGVAAACAVCMSGTQQDTRLAFILMTAFMTFTPLSIVLAVAFWLRHRFRALEASEREDALLGRTSVDPTSHDPYSA